MFDFSVVVYVFDAVFVLYTLYVLSIVAFDVAAVVIRVFVVVLTFWLTQNFEPPF